jgi:hypothetical protein
MKKNDPKPELGKIAEQVARKYQTSIPHLDKEDVQNEIHLKLLTMDHENKTIGYLYKSAEYFAIDLVRKGKYRNHISLNQPVQMSEDGEILTYQDILEHKRHPNLVQDSAEDVYIRDELDLRIHRYIEDLPVHAMDIQEKRLAKKRITASDRNWLSRFRKNINPEEMQDIVDYLCQEPKNEDP